MPPPRRSTAVVAVLLALSSVPPAAAQHAPRSWTQEKCARYADAWRMALAQRGTVGVGAEFIARHEAFVAAGCAGDADVCPRSPDELDLANRLTILAMNTGLASTFLPFRCRP